ncbi:MAG: hypothetical protein ACTSR4_00675 [Candidatus Hodarchaeales archaeon]
MMICAYGDKSDVKILREVGISNPNTIIEPDGTINDFGGPYKNLTVKEAQKAIIKDLEESKHLIASVETERRVPICWRSKTPIEIIAMDEYYLKQVDVIPEIKELIEKMEYYPKSSKIILRAHREDGILSKIK